MEGGHVKRPRNAAVRHGPGRCGPARPGAPPSARPWPERGGKRYETLVAGCARSPRRRLPMTTATPTYWQPEFECMDREEIEQLQLERLESTLTRVHRNVPFYKRKFDEVGFDPDEFRSLDDLRRLPFTTKDDLCGNYPYGLFAVPLRDVVRLHASSGTTGMSAVVG